MTNDALVSFLRAVMLLGSILMVFKLYRTELYRRYPVFFSFFLFRIPNSIWPYFVNVKSNQYFWMWVVTSPIVLAFYVMMVAELYKTVLDRYKGLYTLGRRVMYGSVIISLMISAVSLLPAIQSNVPQRSKNIKYVLAADRGVNTALALFIILILCFVSFLPLRLPRNTRVHALVFSIFFLSNTYVLLMRSLFGLEIADNMNTVLVGVTTASVIAWLALLQQRGEKSEQAPAMFAGPEQESRLLSHLDALNTALLRSSRRATAGVSSR